MKKITLLFLLILSLFPFKDPAEAAKMPIMSMEELTVQVMPEYAYHPKDSKKDKLPVLIGYHGTFMNKSDETINGEIILPLPLKAKDFAIGYIGEYSTDLKDVKDIAYEKDNKSQTVSWKTSREIKPGEMYQFVIEYYVSGMEKDGDRRSFAYSFEGFADIGLLNMVFVEPMKTDTFKVSPALESQNQNSYGINMFSTQFKGVKTGDVHRFEIEYKRSSEKTTSEILDAMAGNQDGSKAAVKNDSKPSIKVYMAIAIGSIIILFALFVVLFKKSKNRKTKKETEDQAFVNLKLQRLRKMLLDGEITEEEYQELVKINNV